MTDSSQLTRLIRRTQAGENELEPKVFERIHPELLAIAGSQMAGERAAIRCSPPRVEVPNPVHG